ncbi:hypothetical protein NKI56_21635 [Mesorhizobium sp. M0622]|uniref:hypothetical protein n=1 Tax=unclassified Mesorhizobium TaxID=325217 RepID=UPI003337C475
MLGAAMRLGSGDEFRVLWHVLFSANFKNADHGLYDIRSDRGNLGSFPLWLKY